MRRFILSSITLFALAMLSACGGGDTTTTVPPGGDSATSESGGDSSSGDSTSTSDSNGGTDSGTSTDSPADVPKDSSSTDAGDDAKTCGAGASCFPYLCKCGRCDPAVDIVCINVKKDCPLDCASSCPEFVTAKCSCADGVCTKS